MTKKIFLIAFLCILTASCQFKSSMLNQDEDKADAIQVIDDLYRLVDAKQYTEAQKLFGEEFFTVTPKEKLTDIFENSREKLGYFKSNVLSDWATEEISGSVNKTDYRLVFDTGYEKNNARETFTLLKKENGPIKIIGYRVESPAFLENN